MFCINFQMKDCLKVFDAELAAAEEAAAPPSTSSTPSKRKSKIPPVLIEGLEIAEPQWCLIDGGKAIVHVMTPKARRTWQVEGVASAFSEVTRDYERLGDGQELEEDEYYDTRDEEDYQFEEDRNDRYSAARYDAGGHVQDKRMHRRNGQPRM